MDIVIVVQAQTLQRDSLTFANLLQRIAVREVGVSGTVLLVQILVIGELVVFHVRRLRPQLETLQGPFPAGGRRLQMTALDPKRSLSVGVIGMLQLAQRLAEKLHKLARQLRLKGLAVEARGILRRGAQRGAKFRDRRRDEGIVTRTRGKACSREWKLLAQVLVVVLSRKRFVALGANQH